MAEYTTITVSKELKADLDADMAEGETWNEFLRRLQGEPAESAPAEREAGLSDDDLQRLRALFREVAEDLDHEPAEPDVDYDRLREIVREEVRRALEELVR